MLTTMYNGRPFEVVSYETQKGKLLASRCENWCGDTLSQVYNRPSETKQSIFEDWYDFYCDDSYADNFSIVSYNAQFFSLGWFTTLQGTPAQLYGTDAAILVTPRHNYMIVFPE